MALFGFEEIFKKRESSEEHYKATEDWIISWTLRKNDDLQGFTKFLYEIL